MESSGTIEKITITSPLVDQIIPENYFTNVDQEEDQPNQKEQISQLQKEIARLQRENKNSNKTKIKVAQLRSLNLIQQKLNNAGLKKESLGELSNYEERINQTNTIEETEVIREMVLLQIEYQNVLRKPKFPPRNKPSKLDN
jgi:hypothetical protein